MSEDVDETLPDGVPLKIAVAELSERKGRAVYLALSDEDKRNSLIISSDTMVVLDDEPLGKPTDDTDAYNTLKRLSGREHFVYTGVAVRVGERVRFSTAETKVIFKELTDEEIFRYLESGEHKDKAGSYGIQEFAGIFAEKIEGDINNVIGLPICALEMAMRRELSSSLFDF